MNSKKTVKAGRPAFFSDPDIDRLLAVTVRLMTEHSVLTERVKTLESLLIESGVINQEHSTRLSPRRAQEAEWAKTDFSSLRMCWSRGQTSQNNNGRSAMEAFWLYLHILLLVFWVGTDVGVFIAAKWSEKTTLSMETRQTVLQLGMVLTGYPAQPDADHLGLSVAVTSGWLDISGTVLGVCGYRPGIWLAILWRGFLSTDPTVQE